MRQKYQYWDALKALAQQQLDVNKGDELRHSLPVAYRFVHGFLYEQRSLEEIIVCFLAAGAQNTSNPQHPFFVEVLKHICQLQLLSLDGPAKASAIAKLIKFLEWWYQPKTVEDGQYNFDAKFLDCMLEKFMPIADEEALDAIFLHITELKTWGCLREDYIASADGALFPLHALLADLLKSKGLANETKMALYQVCGVARTSVEETASFIRHLDANKLLTKATLDYLVMYFCLCSDAKAHCEMAQALCLLSEANIDFDDALQKIFLKEYQSPKDLAKLYIGLENADARNQLTARLIDNPRSACFAKSYVALDKSRLLTDENIDALTRMTNQYRGEASTELLGELPKVLLGDVLYSLQESLSIDGEFGFHDWFNFFISEAKGGRLDCAVRLADALVKAGLTGKSVLKMCQSKHDVLSQAPIPHTRAVTHFFFSSPSGANYLQLSVILQILADCSLLDLQVLQNVLTATASGNYAVGHLYRCLQLLKQHGALQAKLLSLLVSALPLEGSEKDRANILRLFFAGVMVFTDSKRVARLSPVVFENTVLLGNTSAAKAVCSLQDDVFDRLPLQRIFNCINTKRDELLAERNLLQVKLRLLDTTIKELKKTPETDGRRDKLSQMQAEFTRIDALLTENKQQRSFHENDAFANYAEALSSLIDAGLLHHQSVLDYVLSSGGSVINKARAVIVLNDSGLLDDSNIFVLAQSMSPWQVAKALALIELQAIPLYRERILAHTLPLSLAEGLVALKEAQNVLTDDMADALSTLPEPGVVIDLFSVFKVDSGLEVLAPDKLLRCLTCSSTGALAHLLFQLNNSNVAVTETLLERLLAHKQLDDFCLAFDVLDDSDCFMQHFDVLYAHAKPQRFAMAIAFLYEQAALPEEKRNNIIDVVKSHQTAQTLSEALVGLNKSDIDTQDNQNRLVAKTNVSQELAEALGDLAVQRLLNQDVFDALCGSVSPGALAKGLVNLNSCRQWRNSYVKMVLVSEQPVVCAEVIVRCLHAAKQYLQNGNSSAETLANVQENGVRAIWGNIKHKIWDDGDGWGAVSLEDIKGIMKKVSLDEEALAALRDNHSSNAENQSGI